MDPNATLAELRKLTSEVHKSAADGDAVGPEALEMAEFFDELDGGLSRGGLLPKEWT